MSSKTRVTTLNTLKKENKQGTNGNYTFKVTLALKSPVSCHQLVQLDNQSCVAHQLLKLGQVKLLISVYLTSDSIILRGKEFYSFSICLHISKFLKLNSWDITIHVVETEQVKEINFHPNSRKATIESQNSQD